MTDRCERDSGGPHVADTYEQHRWCSEPSTCTVTPRLGGGAPWRACEEHGREYLAMGADVDGLPETAPDGSKADG